MKNKSISTPVLTRMQESIGGMNLAPKIAGVLLCASISTPLLAQSVLEEITVTAQKRSESVQDVPFAITALSADRLSEAGMVDLEDLSHMVPGLQIGGQAAGRSQINIRGINSGEMRRDNVRSSETVGMYLDEIPLSIVLYNIDLEPVDLARVEVLRGPQGTLYGSGSLSGTIRYIANEPVLNEFEGMLDGSYNTIDHGSSSRNVRGMLNVPLGDTLAARIVAYSNDRGGWIDNVATGQGEGPDVNTVLNQGIRLSALWEPNEDWSLKGTYIHQKVERGAGPEDDANVNFANKLVDNGAIPSTGNPNLGTTSYDPTSDPFQVWNLVDEHNDDTADIFNLVIKGDLGFAEVTSSTSYFTREVDVFLDVSGARSSSQFGPGRYRGLHPSIPPASFPGTPATRDYAGVGLHGNRDMETVSQEIRFASTSDGPLQWIGGVYYSNLDSVFDQGSEIQDPIIIPGMLSIHQRPVGNLFFTVSTQTVEQVAVFGEASYSFDKFTVSAGARYFDMNQTYQTQNGGIFRLPNPPVALPNPLNILGPGQTNPLVKPKEDGINPKVILSYDVSDDMMISAQAAKGFRLGGPQVFINPDPVLAADGSVQADCRADIAAVAGFDVDFDGFDSETLWNYELSMKSIWADGRVQFNGSIFHIDYTDLQVNSRLDCGTTVTTNAGGADSEGIEWELRGLIADGLELGFTGSWIDTELTADTLDGTAEEGDPLLFAPDLKYSFSVNYNTPVLDTLGLYASAYYSYTDSVEGIFKNEGPRVPNPTEGSRILDSYATLNLRIGLRSEGDGWDIQLFADNVTDEYAFTQVDSSAPTSDYRYLQYSTIQPRTIGVKASYKF
jgi:iron complex outermembrane receptor protein